MARSVIPLQRQTYMRWAGGDCPVPFQRECE
jgi:hypothetical protein